MASIKVTSSHPGDWTPPHPHPRSSIDKDLLQWGTSAGQHNPGFASRRRSTAGRALGWRALPLTPARCRSSMPRTDDFIVEGNESGEAGGLISPVSSAEFNYKTCRSSGKFPPNVPATRRTLDGDGEERVSIHGSWDAEMLERQAFARRLFRPADREKTGMTLTTYGAFAERDVGLRRFQP